MSQALSLEDRFAAIGAWILEQTAGMNFDQKRIWLRDLITNKDQELKTILEQFGIIGIMIGQFHNVRYDKLYTEKTAVIVRSRKRIGSRESPLDHSDNEELEDNLTCYMVTGEDLKKRAPGNVQIAFAIHTNIASRLRAWLIATGKATPEQLPVPPKSMQQARIDAKRGGEQLMMAFLEDDDDDPDAPPEGC